MEFVGNEGRLIGLVRRSEELVERAAVRVVVRQGHGWLGCSDLRERDYTTSRVDLSLVLARLLARPVPWATLLQFGGTVGGRPLGAPRSVSACV